MKSKKSILTHGLIFLFIILVLLIQNNNVVAVTEQEEIKLDISENYKKWEELPDEEKKNTIQPPIFDLPLIDSIKRSNYNSILRANPTLPNKFNLKDYISINVKNQQKVGACWAFSMSSVLETTMAHKNKISNIMYSPMHIEYKTANLYERVLGVGGSINMAIAYLASGYGPVYENDLPFESVYNIEKNIASNYYLTDKNKVNTNISPKAKAENITRFANIYKSISNGEIIYKNGSKTEAKTYSESEVEAIRGLIKKHIRDNGAVFASFYSDIELDKTNQFSSNFLNNNTNAYYSDKEFNNANEVNNANHAVTIIGWDDNYSKTNFKQDKQPLHDGAYIVLNSYGKDFGDNGYFYVSYDDLFIEQEVCGVDDIKQIEKLDYDEKYEYDELGLNLPLHVNNLKSGYLANVFNRKNLSKKEYLTEVGLFMPSTEGVEIYVNASNDDMKEGQLVASCTGENALEAGYRTVKIANPIEITGSKFVVKVKYINSEGIKLPLECDPIASGILSDSEDKKTVEIYNPASSNPGESYISFDGTRWNDIYGYSVDEHILKETNACIKAFSIYTEEAPTQNENENENDNIKVTGIALNKTSENLEVGKTTTLVATISPSNATNKNITWKSSDETIAKVQNGTVTGIKEGKTTITVTTEDGNYKATCEITVKKIEQNDNENKNVKVTGITLNKTSENIEVGKTISLTATIAPSNATNKNITWKSSDETIAKVQNGIVTGIKEGKATITVTTEDGNYKATCEITVKKTEQNNNENKNVKVTGIALNKTNEKKQVGETFNLIATIYPTNATNKSVKWESSDEKIATISETGIIKTIKEGTCTIKVTSIDGSFSASCVLTVIAKTNNDDDIYKEKNEEKDIPEEDNTIAKDKLPNTGMKTIIVITVLASVTVVISYIKYKNLKEVI